MFEENDIDDSSQARRNGELEDSSWQRLRPKALACDVDSSISPAESA